MAIEFRPANADEMQQIGDLTAYVYGGAFGDGPDNITATSIRPEWTLCAFDGPRLATSFATFPFTMRANGTAISFAGVTAVGTRPDYRRRGLVREIMTRALQQQREAGQSVAGLWASQAAIYRRYGYVAAGHLRRYAIDSVDIRLLPDIDATAQVRLIPIADALDPVKQVYREFIAQRFGYLHRSQILWRNGVFDDTTDGPVFCAIAYQGQQARGYVAFTLRSDKVDHVARGQQLQIRELAWLDMDAYASLWQFIGQHDLVGQVCWHNAPMDDPAPLLMAEPRLLHSQDREGSWMRIVDVPAALAQRGYSEDGEVTLEVAGDRDAPWNNGTWHLQVNAGQGEVAAAKGSADATLSIAALASLYTGMYSARQLHLWGQLNASPATVRRLDSLFAMVFAPHCPDHY